MEEKFDKRVESEINYAFDVEKDGIYEVVIKASCQPGWRNHWWLKIKSFLEDVVDLHLDDDDLRVEIDGITFKKPLGKEGLFNSPTAFSGTKILGKTKTVVFIVHLNKGTHHIHFIPKGLPYLEGIYVNYLTYQSKFLSYLNLRAEKENYYSWYTLALVKLKFHSLSISAKADKNTGETDDDDLKIVVDGVIQENKINSHQKSYFCGFVLKGQEAHYYKELNSTEDIHYVELMADNRPTLLGLNVLFDKDPESTMIDPEIKGEVFNPKYIIKDSSFINDGSLNEREIETFLKEYGEKYPNHVYRKVIEGKKISFWIKKFAFENQINPKVILAKLQAEKGLIIGETSTNPTQDQLNWALGAGSLDTGNVESYRGLLTQLRESPRLFRNYLTKIEGAPLTHSNVDGQPLTVINKATLALYKYTPHMAGANLFYRIYSQFFGNDDLGGEI